MLGDLPQRKYYILTGLGIPGNQRGVVGDHDEAWGVANHVSGGAQLLPCFQQGGFRGLEDFAEIDHVLLGNLMGRIRCHVQGAVAQAGD